MAAIRAAAPLAFANQLPLPTIYSAAGRGIAAVSSAIEESDLYLFKEQTCRYSGVCA